MMGEAVHPDSEQLREAWVFGPCGILLDPVLWTGQLQELCSHHGSLWALRSSVFHLLLSPSFVLRPGPQLSVTQQASL